MAQGNTWIGYKYDAVARGWQWEGTCQSEYENWHSNSYSYPAYMYSSDSYQWYQASSSTSKNKCGCETSAGFPPTPLPTVTPEPTSSPGPTPEPSSPPECEAAFEFFAGHCYNFGENLVDKATCSAVCSALGASTLCVEDTNQNTAVATKAGDNVWLGMVGLVINTTHEPPGIHASPQPTTVSHLNYTPWQLPYP